MKNKLSYTIDFRTWVILILEAMLNCIIQYMITDFILNTNQRTVTEGSDICMQNGGVDIRGGVRSADIIWLFFWLLSSEQTLCPLMGLLQNVMNQPEEPANKSSIYY